MNKADEIKVQWRDRRIIPDLFEKYPRAIVNLVRYYKDAEEPIDWDQLNMYKGLSLGRLILGLSNPEEMNEARKREYRHYYLAPVQTFAELHDLKRAGVCRIIIGAPLFFQLRQVKEFGIPICAVANDATSDSIFTRPDGVTGCWIRPEDVPLYEPYIDVLEFVYKDHTQEQALYRVYAERHEWSGELGMLIHNLNYPCTNRMVPPDLAEKRLECGQRCLANGACHLCYRLFDLANPDLLHRITENN